MHPMYWGYCEIMKLTLRAQLVKSIAFKSLALSSLVFLAACSTTPSTTTDDRPASGQDTSVADLPLDTERSIEELATELPGDYDRTTLIEMDLAPIGEHAYALELAKIFYLRREPEKTARLLSTIPFNRLQASQQRDYALLAAKTELALFNSRDALSWLAGDNTHLF